MGAEEARIDAKDMIEPLPALEAIVSKVMVSGTNSLSAVEWQTMESAMPPEERQTHKNLSLWMQDRAKMIGVTEGPDDDEEDDDPELVRMLENGEGTEEDGAAAAVGDDDDDDEKEDKDKAK